MVVVEHDVATYVEPMLIRVVAITIESQPSIRCPSQIPRRKNISVEYQPSINIREFIIVSKI